VVAFGPVICFPLFRVRGVSHRCTASFGAGATVIELGCIDSH